MCKLVNRNVSNWENTLCVIYQYYDDGGCVYFYYLVNQANLSDVASLSVSELFGLGL